MHKNANKGKKMQNEMQQKLTGWKSIKNKKKDAKQPLLISPALYPYAPPLNKFNKDRGHFRGPRWAKYPP